MMCGLKQQRGKAIITVRGKGETEGKVRGKVESLVNRMVTGFSSCLGEKGKLKQVKGSIERAYPSLVCVMIISINLGKNPLFPQRALKAL